MGEISVLVVAATGVASLIFLRAPHRRRRPAGVRRAGRRAAGRRPRAAPALAGGRRDAAARTAVDHPRGGHPAAVPHHRACSRSTCSSPGTTQPGGGFAGGLVAGLALVAALPRRRPVRAGEAAPVDAGRAARRRAVRRRRHRRRRAAARRRGAAERDPRDCTLPVLGDVHLVTSLFFDIGVYLSWSAWCWTSCAASAPRSTARRRTGRPDRRPRPEEVIVR